MEGNDEIRQAATEQTQDLHTLFTHGVKVRSIANNLIQLLFREQNRTVLFVLIYFALERLHFID